LGPLPVSHGSNGLWRVACDASATGFHGWSSASDRGSLEPWLCSPPTCWPCGPASWRI
jgi:hypothetical protein